jgi:hypothetical protein
MPDSPGLISGGVGPSLRELQDGSITTPFSNPSSTLRNDSPANQLAGSSSSRSFNPAATAEAFGRYSGFANQSQYDFNFRVFPSDLGSDLNSHYMVININVPVVSNPAGAGGGYVSRGKVFNDFAPSNFQLTNGLSTTDQLRGTSGGPLTDINNILTLNLPRGTRRIKEAIALHMPIPTVYTHQNIYEEVSLTAFGAQGLKLGVTAVGKLLAAKSTGAMQQAINSTKIGRVFDPIGGFLRKGAAIAGNPINPKIEVLFSHTVQRAFRMEFLMAPKSQEESETVKNIIDTLRFHAAPEISSIGYIFPTFIPPAEFDIAFYHKGKPNNKIPRINTSVLESIEVDYAPSGIYSTFSNGHSVAIRLSLAFREVEILHKERVAQGF